jgi:hypothetical protein
LDQGIGKRSRGSVGSVRSSLAKDAFDHLQLREEHWVIVDLVGKGGHIRRYKLGRTAKVGTIHKRFGVTQDLSRFAFSRGSGEPLELIQTDEAQYMLDGLLLMIEGVGRTKTDGKLALQALGMISYDDENGAHRMRAYNDGRWLETEIKLVEGGKGIAWGFSLGEIKTSSMLRINENGEWTELADTIGSQPPRKFMELVVRPQR